mmetsp:Transcript_43294/g.102715  ORF Transcript_43294/g.102715 Transcript_43294/m.102715 type:complete len:261 (+) Transcript_43294:117-899(+)|eukprot:CAMPEP_0177593830 /NCGR_PEP_ID=MMETSP0419_2-20121207/9412_1 /TAXON_ID=582737 /ORGANISM="Tetraselmis sp., Strain GSL018" /LENGTH=260 /DNA_ID=CAMNT_0019085009 /DNA_START=102 /DNA_END=884 /DNA_ORIENTATION=+
MSARCLSGARVASRATPAVRASGKLSSNVRGSGFLASAPLLKLFGLKQNNTISASSPLSATRSVHSVVAAAGTPLKAGDAVPNVTFKTRVRIPDSTAENPFDWKDVTSEDLFKGKRVVIFSLPGAFTPTCSSTHLPGYEAAYDDIKACGVDEVYCLSVNDAFVMRQWGLHQGLAEDKSTGNFQKVKLLPDGHCFFTRGMGLNVNWDNERGFGERSWRYSAVINDMKIEQIFIEAGMADNYAPDPFEVSDAQTMLNYLKSK